MAVVVNRVHELLVFLPSGNLDLVASHEQTEVLEIFEAGQSGAGLLARGSLVSEAASSGERGRHAVVLLVGAVLARPAPLPGAPRPPHIHIRVQQVAGSDVRL